MAFTPTNEVERLLIAAVSDEQSRPAFYRALLEHDLFAIADGDGRAGDGRPREYVAQPGTTLNLRMVEYEGAVHAPIFSSTERIAAAISEPVDYIGMNGRAMFTMLHGSKIVMNLGSDFGKVFLPHEVEAMLNGTILQGGPHPHTRLDVGGKKILFGQPKVYPQRLVDGLRQRFSEMREVKAAYLAHVFMPEVDGSPHTLIGIEADGNWDHVVAEAGGVVRAVAEPGQCVDFVQMGRETDQSIRQYMQRDTKPFYRRRRFLGLF